MGILFLLALPSVILSIELIYFLFSGKRMLNNGGRWVIEFISIIIYPALFIFIADSNGNLCCGDSAFFSPEHRLTIYSLIVICVIAYFYSSYRSEVSSPVFEVLVNAFLLIGFVLNIFIAFHHEELFWLIGNIPVGILFLFMLIKNHTAFVKQSESVSMDGAGKWEKRAWSILSLRPILKVPALLILCIPLLTVLASILLLFGQKPDSLIRAFTDTYKHGLSQWDYMCDNVECGGHFLCSVAANGHKEVVSPLRYGERNGGKIICNRQLLIANAFEEIMEQKLPRLHRVIRTKYNKVGDVIHKHYHIFNNKFFADFIYVLMKPLEWMFLLVIYSVDRNPENRIAKQYLSISDRQLINKLDKEKA